MWPNITISTHSTSNLQKLNRFVLKSIFALLPTTRYCARYKPWHPIWNVTLMEKAHYLLLLMNATSRDNRLAKFYRKWSQIIHWNHLIPFILEQWPPQQVLDFHAGWSKVLVGGTVTVFANTSMSRKEQFEKFPLNGPFNLFDPDLGWKVINNITQTTNTQNNNNKRTSNLQTLY